MFSLSKNASNAVCLRARGQGPPRHASEWPFYSSSGYMMRDVLVIGISLRANLKPAMLIGGISDHNSESRPLKFDWWMSRIPLWQVQENSSFYYS